MTAKTLLSAAIIAAALPAFAQAQDAEQWQGFYGGVSLDYISPDVTAGGLVLGLDGDAGASLFAGYNHAVADNFVIGGELSYGGGSSHQLIIPGLDVDVDNRIELSARAGYAIGSTLLYGTLGYMQTDYAVPVAAFEDQASGITYGVGVETLLDDNWSIRLDYEHATLEPDNAALAGVEFEADTISLGVAFHF